ncbi:signal peptidase II [Tautonia plasticadhaerens]|uniref:Lipoprotein signal peptidase n=1 Tax=Tautonia plasticadhaerens TaxID=2527974 RepID=A0A518GXK0_9BACT|nr:signal peptidase II [Tautonia plasticadhaerens]QDV33324.1 lipoprotein signal peptidase [Tautonia plasticadhaerens]
MDAEAMVDAEVGGDRPGRPPIPGSRWVLFWVLALGGAAFDLTTKALVFDRVGPPGSPAVSVIGEVVELRTSYNTGALWGIGGDLAFGSMMFAGLSIVAALFILYWLFVAGHAADRWQAATLGLIMAGAIGNCYDRLRFGHVRDFVHVHVDSIGFDFPIFNFADNMLVLGAVGLMLLALRGEPSPSATVEGA